ncbi:PAS domain-containing protein [Motiliproteus coralliicola]|uniref:histidine kinase n=1 Tax=Motiliproteus coralliicola TaxID=2283196 RepID=A0A369WEX8_9GAMM|nr:ATP-binding protein [Motiliproteus coralliicola]RDE19853.1 PAS domain-containing protein [Motiliproteus coralliicola]
MSAEPSDNLGLDPQEMTEAAWVEVIQQMEQVYSNLISYQVELEQKNRELEEANQLISSVQRAMTEVLMVTDLSGKLIQHNEPLEQMTGRDRIELAQRDIASLFSADDHQVLALVKQHKEFSQREVTLLGQQENLPLIVTGNPLLDSNRQVQGMVLVGREVSELRRAYEDLAKSLEELKLTQQQLVNSEKMASLGRLVAGVAHELNNPISFVYGNTHVLSEYCKRFSAFFELLDQAPLPDSLLDAKQRLKIDKTLRDLPSLLEGTTEGVERVRDIVMDLRQFSSGQQQEFRPFDLVRIINTTLRWVTKEHPIELHCRLPDALELVGHPGRIHQVMMNLVQNSLDVIEGLEQPQLWIDLDSDGENARVVVRDNGPGIDESILPQVFEPFVTTKETGKGTGLGLSLSYSFVRNHGGELSAANHPDGGAEFTLILPLQGFEGCRIDSAPTGVEASS